jgi:hypothetical protein
MVEVVSVSQSKLMPMFKCKLMQVEVLAKSEMMMMMLELQWPQVMRMIMRFRPQLLRELMWPTILMEETVLSQS